MSETGRTISTATAATPPPRLDAAPYRRRRAFGIAAAALVVLGGAGLAVFFAVSGCGTETSASAAVDVEDLPTASVERGSMVATITESGEIIAEGQQQINNDLRWPAVIEYLAPEGSEVAVNDVLIRFKCDELKDAIRRKEQEHRRAQDEHATAVTNLDLMKMQMDAKVRKAEQALEDAKGDLRKYEEAEWPQQQKQAQAQIQLAESDLTLANDQLKSKLTINADPELNQPYSKNEIEAERLTVKRLELALQNAQTDAEILEKYTHPRAVRDKRTAVSDAEIDLLAAKAERDKQLKLAQSAVDTAALNLELMKEEFDRLIEDRQERLVVKAKQPGLVVYETRRARWHRPVTVAIGEEIQPHQQLMIIPDLNSLVLKTQVYEAVHEIAQKKVKGDGLSARIRLDARRGDLFEGRVTKVAELPDSQNPWLSPGVKVYPTTVTFVGDISELNLKPGMTGDVEITLAELDDVLSVPIAAVFSEEDVAFCYCATGDGKAERKIVKVGLTSSSRAQILRGLTAGERVLLAPPSDARPVRKRRERKPEQESLRPSGGGTGQGRREARSRPAGQRGRGERGPATRPARG